MVNGTEIRDPRLEELQRRSLAYGLESTRAVCGVLFPNHVRRPDFSLDDIAALGTAVDSATTVTTLRALGWSLDRWEQWVVEFLTTFLDPAHAGEGRVPAEGLTDTSGAGQRG